MEEEIMSFWVGKEDADMVQEIFDRSEEPKFTIVKRTDIKDSDICQIELVGDNSMAIWHLIKQVQFAQSAAYRMNEIINQAKY